ncbi:TetR/AcrR family transcriptional regulator [Nocardiopsis changdeensis]|uniref:TetR/AcrR family transcriptional regulator n=1 Tax=Nocardiopsis changdeensis TaxID=2831969 RepID=A0ABX8BLL0_9ACTN|nr:MULTISPECIES: TetR family transcriptional regulator [Nocardiopsis]QUX23117.1 TetR/AcrR family transcriptional regulator [Nocardiopsis changdeensis]QYX39062.1 TetR/AcrR family transcriptional regulator [Nocardiopsis sp. MT53]
MGNREDLLAGAKRCLREKGYDRTSVRDIAAAAGVSTAAIGYHYGSRETLLGQALFALLDEWGDELGRALSPGGGDDAQGFERMWERLVGQFAEHPDLWTASVELFLQARRQPALRAQLTEGVGQGWRGMAAILLSTPEEEVTDRSARTLGMAQTALMTGVMIQSLSDPENAPTAAEVLEGLRGLARIAGPS